MTEEQIRATVAASKRAFPSVAAIVALANHALELRAALQDLLDCVNFDPAEYEQAVEKRDDWRAAMPDGARR